MVAIAIEYEDSTAYVDEYELIAETCRESFFEFLKEFWEVVVPGEELKLNWHIEYLCNKLQIYAERVFKGLPKKKDIIINIPPGTTKSTIVSIMFPAWVWTRMPAARFLCGSYADELADELSRKCRIVVMSGKYQKCFPEVELAKDQNAKSKFANTAGGARMSCTVGGKSPIGRHAHFLLIDDPIDPEDAKSEVKQKAANNFMNEILPSRKVDKAVSLTVLIMHRLHQYVPTGNWLARPKAAAKVLHICLPAKESEHVNPPELKEYYQDGFLDPQRLSDSILEEQLEKSEYAYAGQYQQNPIPLGGGMFKVHKLNIEEEAPKGMRMYRYWDNASTKDGNGAYTVGALIGEEIKKDGKPRYWILDIKRGRWSSDVREDIKLQTAQIDTRDVRIGQEQEPGSGGKDQADATVRNLAGFRVEIIRPTGDKADRADPLSVQVNRGNVYVLNREWLHALIDEMQYFPYSTFKDQIDALSGAFSMAVARRIRVGAL